MKAFSLIAIFFGISITASLAAAHFSGQINLLEISWLWLTLLLAANLLQMGVTGFCPTLNLLYAIGLKDKQSGNKK